MLEMRTVLSEIKNHLYLIWVVARYENKATFKGHYFGLAWEILDPLIQVGIYFFVFGTMRGDQDIPVGFNNENFVYVQFLPWMLVGMSVWLFMNRVTLLGSKSIQKKITLVSKMKFPTSTIPAMTLSSRLTSYFVTIVIVIIIVWSTGFGPTLLWFQWFYYFLCMLVFTYFFALLNATLTMIFKDYHQMLAPFMRILFFFSDVIWDLTGVASLPNWVVRVSQLNPFVYIINGFRFTFFGQGTFWQQWETTLFFWLVVFFLAIVSSHLHLKYRSKFIDLV